MFILISRCSMCVLLACTVMLALMANPVFANPPEYVFLTPAQWISAEPLATWAIPRRSLVGDTLCVKPTGDGLTDSLQAALHALNVDSAELVDLATARARIASATWQEVTP